MHKKHGDQVSGGVFLIGLGILFLTGAWWPGILLLIGATALAKGIFNGDSSEHWGGVFLIGLALFFWVGFRWELLLIAIGVSMIIGRSHWKSAWWCDGEKHDKSKRKNGDKSKNDDYEVEYI